MSAAVGMSMGSVANFNASTEIDTGGAFGMPGTFASKYDNMDETVEQAVPQNVEGRNLNRSEPTMNQRGSGRGGY